LVPAVTPITVDPSALAGAGVSVGALGDGLVTAITTLAATFNANTGQDAAGVLFGRQYENTGRDLLRAATAGINACRNTGYRIQVTAVNYSRADAASDISGRGQPLPAPPCPARTCPPGPPSPTGGGIAEPLLWSVVEFLVGDLWPNGDPTAMRAAASSWRTFSTALYHVTSDTSGAYNVIGAQQIQESEAINASVRDIGTLLSSVAGTCQTLANQLDAFSSDVEQTQQAIRNLLNKLGSIGGIVGTFFEFVKGHGDDELDEIADDIKTVLSHVKTEVEAEAALVEAAKQNVDGWALGLERFADRTFVEFFGEGVGHVLGNGFNAFADAREGDFRWAVGMVQSIEGMNPLRFTYDPQGALQTWKGVTESAALLNPSMIPAIAASDPERVKNILKGIARVGEWDPNRPMLSLEQNMLDVASMAIPAVGEAGAASAAARGARAAEVADEASGVARVAGTAGDATRASGALGDISKQAEGVTGKLDDIAKNPMSAEPHSGGRPVTPTQPVEPPSPPVTKQPLPESTPPHAAVPIESSRATPPVVAHNAASAPERVPVAAPADTAHTASASAPASGGAPISHIPPPEAPHTPAPAAGDHPAEPGAHHESGDHHGHGDGRDGGAHDDIPDGPPDHLPNDHVDGDSQQPGAATETEHKPTTNEPVDVATGEYLLPGVDIDLPGVLPLHLTRQHRSQFRHGLWFGPTWASTLDTRAVVTRSGITTIDGDGTMRSFDLPAADAPSVARTGQRWTLHADASGGYRLDDPQSVRRTHFAPLPQLDGSDVARGVLAVSAITDRNGNRIQFVYNEIGVPVRVERSDGTAVDVETRGGRVRGYRVTGVPAHSFGYADGDLTSVANGVGAVTQFEYDDAHRMVSWTDSAGAHYTNTYDSQGRVVAQTGTDGVWAGEFDYVDDGTVFTDALGNQTTYRFDAELRPIAVTNASGATTTYRYDEEGRVAQLTDPLGHVLAVTYHDGKPSRARGPDGALTRYDYDDRGNLVAVHDSAGGIHRWEYDTHGAINAQIDPLGRRIEIDNSTSGLPERITDALGNETRLEYDTFGRPVTLATGDGAVTTMAYDSEGRLVSRLTADGARESWVYDGEGNCVAFRNAAGATTRWEYGYYDLVTGRVDADGGRTEYDYNVARQLISVTNPAGLVWRYAYRPDGLLASESDFNGAITGYEYDPAGRLAERTNAVGHSVHYGYDAAGNLVSESSGAEVVSYEYDAAGRRIAATNAGGRLDLARDAAGRVIVESWNGRAVVSTFNAAGDLLEIRTPSGLRAQLSYDDRGVAQALTVAGRPCEVSTDALGRATTYRYGTAEVSSSWDVLGRLTGRALCVEQVGVLASAGYQYHGDGELSDVRPGADGAALGTPARYDTDAVGRLTARTLADGSRNEFHFDASVNVQLGAERWEYRGVLLVDDGRSRYSYDRAGRLTTISTRRLGRKADVWHYRWDAWDRLRELVSPDGTTVRYTYDPLGRRVAKEGSDGTRVDFSWSGTRMVEQVSTGPEPGVTSWAYLPGESTPQIQVSQSNVDREFFALVTDQVGAPVAVLDPRTGAIAGQSKVSAWGLTSWSGVSTPWRFPGQYFDEESGLHYNFHRYYHPGAGRYISPDPLGLAPAPNPYGYPTNPTGWVDPLGLNPCQGGPGEAARSHMSKVGPNSYQSPGGLEYGPDLGRSVVDHRIEHVLRHMTDNPGRVEHGVFGTFNPRTIFNWLDHAYAMILDGESVGHLPGLYETYCVDMGYRVGYGGGRAGLAANFPSLTHIRIALADGNKVMTAFPDFGPR
jgi:RHS repeat-associated protein